MKKHGFTTRVMNCAALALIFAFTAQAQNNRSFVATTGNDANTCSASAYCRTFTRALAVTNSGGEIVVVNSGGYGPATITQAVVITAIGIDASIKRQAVRRGAHRRRGVGSHRPGGGSYQGYGRLGRGRSYYLSGRLYEPWRNTPGVRSRVVKGLTGGAFCARSTLISRAVYCAGFGPVLCASNPGPVSERTAFMNTIARGTFTSIQDLSRKLVRYIRAYSKTARHVKGNIPPPRRRILPC